VAFIPRFPDLSTKVQRRIKYKTAAVMTATANKKLVVKKRGLIKNMATRLAGNINKMKNSSFVFLNRFTENLGDYD